MNLTDLPAWLEAIEHDALAVPKHLAVEARRVKQHLDDARKQRIEEWRHQGRDTPYCPLNLMIRARGKAALEISWRRSLVRLPGVKRTRTVWKHCSPSDLTKHVTDLDYDLVMQAQAEIRRIRGIRDTFAHLAKVLRAANTKLAQLPCGSEDDHYPTPRSGVRKVRSPSPTDLAQIEMPFPAVPRPSAPNAPSRPALRDRS